MTSESGQEQKYSTALAVKAKFTRWLDSNNRDAINFKKIFTRIKQSDLYESGKKRIYDY